jgi:aminoglycoside 6'-N-acetyltransferase
MRVPPYPLEGARTTVRPAIAADAPMLAGWHSEPDVSAFWDDEQFSHEEILERLARPEVDAYIVEEAGQAVGYLQAWFESSADGERCGLDMFLMPSARDRGLGPDAATTMTAWLTDIGYDEVTVDPYVSNHRAVSAWTKAGFRIVGRRPPDAEHREAWYLMVICSADVTPA